MGLKDNDVSWFRPLWRRIAVTVFLALWCAWELLWTHDQFWALLVGAALAYALYSFFYAFPKEEPQNGDQPEAARPPEGDDRPSS